MVRALGDDYVNKHILPFMDFKPIIEEPELMDKRLFLDEPMGLLAELLNLNMHERVQYDPDRNILFVNLEGWHARTKKDIDELRKLVAGPVVSYQPAASVERTGPPTPVAVSTAWSFAS